MGTVLKSTEASYGPVYYRMSDGHNDPALVFIHGAVGDSRLFRHQLRYFGKSYRTIALDLPGHGRSASALLPDLGHFAEAVERICEAEMLTRVVLVGHSMGGGVSFELYKRGTIDIAAIVLVSTAPELPVPDELYHTAAVNHVERFSDLLIGSVFSKKTGLLVEMARRGMTDFNMAMVRNDMNLCRAMDYNDLLERITVPVLVVATAGDRVIAPEKTAAMGERIPGAQKVLFNFDGHVPFFEYDDEFNAAVAEFINGIHQVAACF